MAGCAVTDYDTGRGPSRSRREGFRALNYGFPHDDANLLDVEMRYMVYPTGRLTLGLGRAGSRDRSGGWTVVGGLRLNVINGHAISTTITVPAGEHYYRVQFRHQSPNGWGPWSLHRDCEWGHGPTIRPRGTRLA